MDDICIDLTNEIDRENSKKKRFFSEREKKTFLKCEKFEISLKFWKNLRTFVLLQYPQKKSHFYHRTPSSERGHQNSTLKLNSISFSSRFNFPRLFHPPRNSISFCAALISHLFLLVNRKVSHLRARKIIRAGKSN